MGFKFSWISCALPVQEKLLYITKGLKEVCHENINPQNHLSFPNHEKLDPRKLPTIWYTFDLELY